MNKRTIAEPTDMGSWEIRHEEWNTGIEGDDMWTAMDSAYTKDGVYIGDEKRAHYLVDVKGIKPELRTGTSNVASIGYSEKEGKWYGWSHRAMFGFEVGYTVSEGEIVATEHTEGEPPTFPPGTVISSLEEAKEAAMSFASAVA